MMNLFFQIWLLSSLPSWAQDFVTTFPSYTFTCKGINSEAHVAGVFLPGGDGCCGSALVRSTAQIMPGQYMADTASFSVMNAWVVSWESKFQGEYIQGISSGKYSLFFENSDTQKLNTSNSTQALAELSAHQNQNIKTVKMNCEIIKQTLFK